MKELFVNSLHIHGCQDCGYCTGLGRGQCIQKDGMTEVMDGLKKADMLVLASPIYYFTMNGQMQCAIDRLYPLFAHPFNVKKTAFILTSGADGVYELAVKQYHQIFTGWMGLADAGTVTVHDIQNQSEAKRKEAFALGRSLN